MDCSVGITGIGIWSAFGDDVGALYQAVREQRPASAVATAVPVPQDLPPASSSSVAMVCAKEPPILSGLRRPYPDRFTQMALLAADTAFASAGLVASERDPCRVGMIGTSCFGPGRTVETYLRALLLDGPSRVSPIGFARTVANAVVGEVSRRHRLEGPSSLLLGSSCIAYAYDALVSDEADAMLCLGVDEVREVTGWVYSQNHLLDEGLTIGEAAAAVVLERTDRSSRPPLALVRDYATTFCPESTFRLTSVTSSAIATALNDLVERRVLGDRPILVGLRSGDPKHALAEREALNQLNISPRDMLAPKVTIGETFGASEVLQTALGALHLREEERGTSCLVNTSWIGGQVCCIALSRH